MTEEFELLSWDEEILEVLKEVPLNQIQWETFLNVIKILDTLGSVSNHYIRNRYNVGIKVTDRILTSLLQLGWGYFSKGRIHVTEQAKEDFQKLKEFDDDDS